MLIKMSIEQYRKTHFHEDSAPCSETIRRQIKRGILQGVQPVPRGKYYVLVESGARPTTGNTLADNVLKDWAL